MSTLSVGVITTFAGPKISATPAEQLQYGIYRLPPEIDVIALPEDTRFVQYMSPDRTLNLQAYFFSATVLDSGSLQTPDGYQPQIQVYDTVQDQVATSSKEFLMVFGEYLPWLYRGVGHLLGLTEVVAKLDEEHRYVVTEPRPLTVNGISISVKLCSDAMSPRIYARDTRQGATMLFNLASHGWFHHSRTLHNTAVRVGQVRAVENGRWYVRAGHDSPSVVLDHRGTVVLQQPWFGIEPLVVSVPVLTHRTPYTLLGVWVLLVPLGVLGYLYSRHRRARIRPEETV
jgi:apolipoprotein N-acyltransferase